MTAFDYMYVHAEPITCTVYDHAAPVAGRFSRTGPGSCLELTHTVAVPVNPSSAYFANFAEVAETAMIR